MVFFDQESVEEAQTVVRAAAAQHRILQRGAQAR